MNADDPLSEYVGLHARRALDGLAQLDGPAQLDGDPSVESVHDTRTSLRRLRATQRSFPCSFETSRCPEDELRAVALALGAVRDADVLAEILEVELETLSGPLATGPHRADLEHALHTLRRQSVHEARAVARTTGWARVITQLEHWAAQPPALLDIGHAARLERLRARVQDRLADAGDDPVALHSARKAAKRWRYAAELLEPLEPVAAVHLEQAAPVQEALGAVQDTVLLSAFLRHAGDAGSTEGSLLDVLRTRARHRLEEQVAPTSTLL